ncbi:hypothetical protein GCM10009720_29500 [Yaniella flava]|uniref:Uncharacterized protein n=1 Tax=Yaniella flava TaxID=287930 RepID=A0ABN2V0G5_9MICC
MLFLGVLGVVVFHESLLEINWARVGAKILRYNVVRALKRVRANDVQRIPQGMSSWHACANVS